MTQNLNLENQNFVQKSGPKWQRDLTIQQNKYIVIFFLMSFFFWKVCIIMKCSSNYRPIALYSLIMEVSREDAVPW